MLAQARRAQARDYPFKKAIILRRIDPAEFGGVKLLIIHTI